MRRQRLSGWMAPTLAAAVLAACAEQPLPGPATWTVAEQDANRRCQAGSAAACGQLGRQLLARSDATDKDRQRALVLLEMACGQDDVTACAVLGDTYGARHGDDARGAARASELLARACDRKLAPACTALGALALTRQRPREEAAGYFRAGCDLGDAEGCERHALLISGGPLGGDEAAAEAAFAKACELGRESSCHRLAERWLRDPARREEGVRRLTAACRKGQRAICVAVALQTAPLVSARADCPQAAPFAAEACQGGQPDGCAIVAACRVPDAAARPDALAQLQRGCDANQPLACLYWADAQSGTAPPEKVTNAYTAACRRDSPAAPIACTRLVVQTLATTRLSFEAERLLGNLRTICSQSVGEACCALAGEYETGRWTPADAARATELRARACELGQPRCCPNAVAPAPTSK